MTAGSMTAQTGCLVSYVYHEILTLTLLSRVGIDTVIEPAQHDCPSVPLVFVRSHWVVDKIKSKKEAE